MVAEVIDIDKINHIKETINEKYELYKKTEDTEIMYELLRLIINNINYVNDKDLLNLEIKDNKTVLDLYLEPNISSEEELDKFILKHDDLLFKVLKAGKTDILQRVPKELYKKEIDGITILEYLIKNNMVRPYHIYNAGNEKYILDIIKKNNKFELLKYVDEELLFSNFDENKKVIDYLFENNLMNNMTVYSIKEHTEIVDYLFKYKRKDLFNNLHSQILMKKINGRTLLEELLDNGIRPQIGYVDDKDMLDILLKFKLYGSLKGISSEFLLYNDPNTNKPLLQVLLEEGIECECLVYELYNKNENTNKICKIIYDSGRLELLNRYDEEMLLWKGNDNETLLENLLKEGYTPLITKYTTKESLDILIKTESYNELQKCSYELLNMQMPSGKKVYLELLDMQLNIHETNITDNEIMDAVLEYERYELLRCFSTKQMLSYANIGETYFEVILKTLKDKEEQKEIENIPFDDITLNEKAKVYVLFAKYEMQDITANLSKEDLLKIENNTTLLEELINEDSFVAINYIIPDNLKKDIDVAIMLKLSGFNVGELNYPNFTQNISKEFLNDELSKYEKIQLSAEKQTKLDELHYVMSDGKTSTEMINLLISSYKYALFIDSCCSAEIDFLINYKRNNPDFSIKEKQERSHYSRAENCIVLKELNIDTLNHELGHLFFHKLGNSEIPDEFKELIKKERKSLKTHTMVSLYSKKYMIMKGKIKHYVDSYIMRKYDKNITQEQINNIEEYLKRLKERKMYTYLNKGYDEETLNIIFNQMFTVKDFMEQSKQIKRREMIDSIFRIKHGPFISVGDYFDGIFEGEFQDGKIPDVLGFSNVKGGYGHGMKYYKDGTDRIFNEMIANYSEILKSKNPSEGLKELRFYVGNKLVNVIEKYYKENILDRCYSLDMQIK